MSDERTEKGEAKANVTQRTGPDRIPTITRGVQPGPAVPVSPLEKARAENDALRERLAMIKSLGEMEVEKEKLRRQVEQVEKIAATVQALSSERPTEPPTQELVAERLGIDKRELQRRLKPYPGLWKYLTASIG